MTEKLNIIIVVANSILASFAIISFLWQYSRNKKQKFENKFYELLRMHRQNVDEMKLGSLEKREVFKGLYYEYYTYVEILNNYFALNSNLKTVIDSPNRMNLAYKIFFYGNEFNNTIDELKKLNLDHEERQKLQQEINTKLAEYSKKSENKEFSYKTIANQYFVLFTPYLGHSQQLGHYFRHLFQTVKFIDNSNLKDKEKYNYVKILRAQLSDYEQLMFFYNAISDLGSAWFENRKDSLTVKYKLLKNIPLPYAMGYSPIDKYREFEISEKQIKSDFEWFERQKK